MEIPVYSTVQEQLKATDFTVNHYHNAGLPVKDLELLKYFLMVGLDVLVTFLHCTGGGGVIVFRFESVNG